MNATVYMPDFFEPNKPFPIDKFPPKTDEEKDDLQKFFAGPAKPELAVENLKRVGKTLRDDGAKWVGAYGMCWGKHSVDCTGTRPSADISTMHRWQGDHPRWLLR